MVAGLNVMLARQMGRNSERMETKAMCAVRKCFWRREGRIAENGDM